MKIAVIDNYDSFVFNLVRYIRESDNETVVMRNNQLNYEEIDRCDAILLSPGPGIPSEAGNLLKVIKKYHLTKPILGVCLGHQAIAEFMKGSLVRSSYPYHGKSSRIHHNAFSKLFQGISQQFDVGRYHSWCVDELPDELIVTALSDENEVMAFEHECLPIYGVQFHPESILTANGRTIIKNWLSVIQNEL